MLSTATKTQSADGVTLNEAYRGTGDRRSAERIFDMHGKLPDHIVRRYADSPRETYKKLRAKSHIGGPRCTLTVHN